LVWALKRGKAPPLKLGSPPRQKVRKGPGGKAEEKKKLGGEFGFFPGCFFQIFAPFCPKSGKKKIPLGEI